MRWSRGPAAGLAVGCAAILALTAGVLPAKAQSLPSSRFVVVIDAAHGGADAGGRLSSGQLEKNVTLELSVRLRSLLAARGIAVTTTRESDIDVDAVRRAEIANHARAGACLSLHASETGSGIHLFTSSLAPTQPARFEAWKTAQGAWISRSLALAGAINFALLHAGFDVTLSRTALTAVDSMTCPALALEVAPARGADGKVTAEPDDATYQASVANALASALLEWRMEGRQP